MTAGRDLRAVTGDCQLDDWLWVTAISLAVTDHRLSRLVVVLLEVGAGYSRLRHVVDVVHASNILLFLARPSQVYVVLTGLEGERRELRHLVRLELG